MAKHKVPWVSLIFSPECLLNEAISITAGGNWRGSFFYLHSCQWQLIEAEGDDVVGVEGCFIGWVVNFLLTVY